MIVFVYVFVCLCVYMYVCDVCADVCVMCACVCIDLCDVCVCVCKSMCHDTCVELRRWPAELSVSLPPRSFQGSNLVMRLGNKARVPLSYHASPPHTS